MHLRPNCVNAEVDGSGAWSKCESVVAQDDSDLILTAKSFPTAVIEVLVLEVFLRDSLIPTAVCDKVSISHGHKSCHCLNVPPILARIGHKGRPSTQETVNILFNTA